ncbi:dihydrofolate reductase family protein [Streptomyces sp. NPDC020996]|uniref:dihydrofolate reductase family protein n=1 Tax=Streptomyces sp. NPDC020996 TaxID=3154791 RepID=UPI0033E1057B
MRKIVLMMSVSLDGYFEGPGHDISWHRVDDEVHRHLNDTVRRFGGLLSGRRTYELMAGYWPTADADPDAPAAIVEFAGIWREMPKVVYSRTVEEGEWNTVVVRDVVPGEVRALKERAGGDLGLGGAEVAAEFMRLGLVDEYRVYVHPVLLGQGRRLFPEGGEIGAALRLVESRTFGNGVVLLHYERHAPDPHGGSVGGVG